MSIDLEIVPESHREVAITALRGAFGVDGTTGLTSVTGGASGALTYRVDTDHGPHLLRIEAEVIQGPMRNPHQYACMQTAADAGIAPPIRYVDDVAGVVVMPLLDVQPLADFPGGSPALAAAAASLLARLHETALFPTHGDRLADLGRLLDVLPALGRVAPGLLDRHREGFERIRAAYPWRPDEFMSCHNDPNPQNLLFDGDRLWLVDWETAERNDPFLDLATVVSFLGTTDDLRDVILRTALGRVPTPLDRARLTLMGRVVELFTGCILLLLVTDPAAPTHTDLDAPSFAELQAAVASGSLVVGQPATSLAFAKVVLQQFLDALEAPDFAPALATAAAV